MSIVELSFLSLTHAYFSMRVQLQRLFEHCRSTNFVCALDAMVRKLISLICFDIFQSKRYRNALIGVPDDKTNSEKRLLWQTTCLIEKCGRIQSRGYFN